MASYSAQYAVHKTAGAGVVDDVTLKQYGKTIEVIHRDGTSTDPLYFRFGPTVAGITNPTAAADDTFAVHPGETARFPYPIDCGSQVCVKLICASAEPYSVQVLTERSF